MQSPTLLGHKATLGHVDHVCRQMSPIFNINLTSAGMSSPVTSCFLVENPSQQVDGSGIHWVITRLGE